MLRSNINLKQWAGSIAASLILTACASAEPVELANDAAISSHLSGTAFVTSDLEASVQFYTELLGYKERRRAVLTGEAATAVFGVSADAEIDYVALVPSKFSDENPNYPGLNFAGIANIGSLGLEQDAARNAKAGELVMAFQVEGLAEISARADRAGVPVVAPLAPSATGLSQTLTLLDPNGVRIQMYEYVSE